MFICIFWSKYKDLQYGPAGPASWMNVLVWLIGWLIHQFLDKPFSSIFVTFLGHFLAKITTQKICNVEYIMFNPAKITSPYLSVLTVVGKWLSKKAGEFGLWHWQLMPESYFLNRWVHTTYHAMIYSIYYSNCLMIWAHNLSAVVIKPNDISKTQFKSSLHLRCILRIIYSTFVLILTLARFKVWQHYSTRQKHLLEWSEH